MIFLSAAVVKIAVTVLPGMGEVVDKIDRPGKAFASDSHARAEWSIFDAEVKGPSAGAEAAAEGVQARAFAKAEVASASASVGPAKVTVGLSADTGVEVGLTQVEAKVLGTGISFGRKMGVSLFGTGFEFKMW